MYYFFDDELLENTGEDNKTTYISQNVHQNTTQKTCRQNLNPN